MAADGLHTVVYQRCITRQLRVLDTKIARLELQLNNEMEKISSCSELLDEIITKPRSSSCSALREELHKARAKRDKVYQDFHRKHHQEISAQGSSNNAEAADGGGAFPPADDAMSSK
ncbi:unnamed protein product [Urochloa humidicola]